MLYVLPCVLSFAADTNMLVTEFNESPRECSGSIGGEWAGQILAEGS
jgi:hypothetical protein